MADNAAAIVNQLRKKIEGYTPSDDQRSTGTVLEVGDGIARIAGIDDVQSMETLEFVARDG